MTAVKSGRRADAPAPASTHDEAEPKGGRKGSMGTNAVGTGKTVAVKLEAAETEWEIAPGHVVPGYGFNGQVPGPIIEADAGDTLVVDLANSLPEPTSIH